MDRWEWEDDRAGALEDEIDRLTEAFQLGELALPKTDEHLVKFKVHVEELRKMHGAARSALQKRRDASPVPAD